MNLVLKRFTASPRPFSPQLPDNMWFGQTVVPTAAAIGFRRIPKQHRDKNQVVFVAVGPFI